MSYTTVIAVYPNEKTECYQELNNSWGSAPPVWGAMTRRYLGDELVGFREGAPKLWPLWKRLDIPAAHRAVLMMTYDRAYVGKEHFERAARDIETFMRDFPELADGISHWPALMKLFLDNPDIPGIGLWCTSVSDNPFDGDWNEEKEEYNPPDWSDVYEIYQELDKLKNRRGVT